MLTRQEAIRMVDYLTSYNFVAQAAFNYKDEYWVGIIKPNGKIQRVFISVSSVQKFIDTQVK